MAKEPHCFLTSVLVVVLLCTTQYLFSDAQETNEKPPIETEPDDPWFGQPLPPQPRKGYYAFLGRCIDNLTRACGKQVSHFIFDEKRIDGHCCCKLEKMGQLCSTSLSFTLSQIPKFQPQAERIYQRNDLAFDKCSKVSKGNC